MQWLFQILSLIFSLHFVRNTQPNFPPQIVFTVNTEQNLYAIDEVNQRAVSVDPTETGFLLKHIPYATPDSPEDKYYVQLIANRGKFDCMYETYWQYGGSPYNMFPSHWQNGQSIEVKTYLQFKHEMIHSTNSSDTEDYWYSNEQCQPDSGEQRPCEQMFFKKNTDIPLRYIEVRRVGWDVVPVTTEYNVISVGEPDQKYFEGLPKNWSIACRDVNLGIFIYSQTTKIPVEKSDVVQVWLTAPPHRIDGNDTVTIRWNTTEGCTDCLTWTPKELSFNIDNFQDRQNITFTRTKAGPKTTLYPIFNGGGFNLVIPVLYPLFIE